MTGFRDRFVCPDGHYLLSHSIGCLPRSAGERLHRHYLEPWAHDGADTWRHWFEAIEQFRHYLGRVLHAEAPQFSPQSNVSSALTKIIHGLPPRPGRETIVLSERDFPTIGFVAAQARRVGYRLRFISRDENVRDAAVWRAAIGDDTRIVCATHVLSNTGERLPVREIAAIARERDAVSIIDVAQSAGSVPIDLAAWRADFVIGSCVKWLCGGSGAGFLWGSPQALSDCEPIDVGWFSHADPFEMDIRAFRYAGDARRFWGGTPSIAPFVTANAGLETLLGIGIDAVITANSRRVDLLLDNIPPACVRSPTDPALRGGTVVVATADDEALAAALRAARIHYDQRADGIRLSPHIYNDDDDVLAAAACINGVR